MASQPAWLSEVSGDRARAHVRHIGEQIPSRLAGSPNCERMAAYALRELQAAGVEAIRYEYPGLVSFPGPAQLRVLAPEERAIPANALGHSVPTLPGGIEGELVYIGSGGEADYAGKDVRGKVTLSELSYAPARHEKQRLAGPRGSIAQVMMNWGADDNAVLPYGSVKPCWGNPTPETMRAEMPTIPCLGIARTAGQYLKRLCEGGPVRVWLRVECDNAWRRLQQTVGRIPGTDGTGDFVILGGHMDSWPGPQATDNAAGSACFLEIARVFAAHRDPLRRGLTFGFWVGHETGTMVGSSWFVDRFWDDLRAHAVAYLQVDQPAMTGTSRWITPSNAELKRFHQRVERDVLGEMPLAWHRLAKTGDTSFFGIGIPTLAPRMAFTEEEVKATARATLGWWHHSDANTLDKVDPRLLGIHLQVYARYLWELCTLPILPMEFVTVAEQFRKRLADLAALPGLPDGLDLAAVVRRAEALAAAAARLDGAAEGWARRYADGSVTDGEPATLLNEGLKRLSRLLIPAASTAVGTYGHDPYGLSAQAEMIPALVPLREFGRLDPQGEAHTLLATKMVRERNRLADALGEAIATIETTLARVGTK
jgi:hypothetical protein